MDTSTKAAKAIATSIVDASGFDNTDFSLRLHMIVSALTATPPLGALHFLPANHESRHLPTIPALLPLASVKLRDEDQGGERASCKRWGKDTGDLAALGLIWPGWYQRADALRFEISCPLKSPRHDA